MNIKFFKNLFFFFQPILLFGQITLYFTPSKKTYFEFVRLLKKANKSVYIATFSISPYFLKFLEDKNIDVKVVCNYGNVKNFKLKNFEGKGLFHPKFIIVDEHTVIITSANLLEEHFYKNHNNFVIIENKEIAKYLIKKFDAFWNGDEFRDKFISDNIEIWFSPENDCEELIKREIEKASKSIEFAFYTFTNRQIAEKLIMKKWEKVDVRGIIESYNIYPYSIFYLFLSYGGNLRKSNMSGFLHDKFFIFDREKVITGSFNLTKGAKNNIELTLFINNRKIAEEFYKEWKKLYIFKSIVEKF